MVGSVHAWSSVQEYVQLVLVILSNIEHCMTRGFDCFFKGRLMDTPPSPWMRPLGRVRQRGKKRLSLTLHDGLFQLVGGVDVVWREHVSELVVGQHLCVVVFVVAVLAEGRYGVLIVVHSHRQQLLRDGETLLAVHFQAGGSLCAGRG